MIYLKVTPKTGADFTEFVIECQKNPVLQKFTFNLLHEHHVYERERIQQIIIEEGQTAILKKEVLLEHIIEKGATPNKIISIIHLYLEKLFPDNELIIVDPYFYPKKHALNYTEFVKDVLSPFLSVIDEIKIITSTQFHPPTKILMDNELYAAKPTLIISHKTTDDYHDRFWISGERERGILMGTSMNGLGNKYALLDRLNKSDVRKIVAELTSAGLI